MRNVWTDERVAHFATAYSMAQCLESLAGIFGLANAHSVRATASWLRSLGYEIMLRN